MKQTAVEWLVEQYKKVGGISISMAEQAKEMEKEQINQAAWDGYYQEGMIDIRNYYDHNYKQQEQ